MSKDRECVVFLQWALPQLRLRWPGFRRVRGQVCKRLQRHIRTLGLNDLSHYRAYLDQYGHEWGNLDRLCRVSISRFVRDRAVYEALETQVLPQLARAAGDRSDHTLRVWSAGCASGEEPYSVSLVWHLCVRQHHPDVSIRILATDSDAHMLARARGGQYPPGALRELKRAWITAGFAPRGADFQLLPHLAAPVELRCHDVRQPLSGTRRDLILCRNLAFTYFARDLQCEVLSRMLGYLEPEGVLVIGGHETLPQGNWPLVPLQRGLPMFRRLA